MAPNRRRPLAPTSPTFNDRETRQREPAGHGRTRGWLWPREGRHDSPDMVVVVMAYLHCSSDMLKSPGGEKYMQANREKSVISFLLVQVCIPPSHGDQAARSGIGVWGSFLFLLCHLHRIRSTRGSSPFLLALPFILMHTIICSSLNPRE